MNVKYLAITTYIHHERKYMNTIENVPVISLPIRHIDWTTATDSACTAMQNLNLLLCASFTQLKLEKFVKTEKELLRIQH